MQSESPIENLEADLQRMYRALFQYKSWLHMQREAGVDIDRAGATLLKAVMYSDGKTIRPQDIAHYLGIEAPSITRKVQQLESAGYITRSPDPKDGRAYNLSVTSKGKSQLNRLQKARRKSLEAVLQDWTQAERDEFNTLFHKFSIGIEQTMTPHDKEIEKEA